MKKYIVMQKVGYKVVEYTFDFASEAVKFLDMISNGKVKDDYGEDANYCNMRIEEVDDGEEADI